MKFWTCVGQFWGTNLDWTTESQIIVYVYCTGLSVQKSKKNDVATVRAMAWVLVRVFVYFLDVTELFLVTEVMRSVVFYKSAQCPAGQVFTKGYERDAVSQLLIGLGLSRAMTDQVMAQALNSGHDAASRGSLMVTKGSSPVEGTEMFENMTKSFF